MLSEDLPAYLSEYRAGSLLAGYRLETRIGLGGMAQVYRARDERLGRPVALKILEPTRASDPEFRQRFIAESRAAAAVDDPHIIPVYEAGEVDGVLFIAMRFVQGGDLRLVLHHEGPLSAARAADFISPVASALDAAHRAGLVHRDVKPENILVDSREGRPDHVYLSDFGASKGAMPSAHVTLAGHYVGTPDYMAPEQIDGRAVDGRADQYALACVTYELLTGAVPFKRDTVMAVLLAHMTAPRPSLVSRRPDLPGADKVLAKAMAKVTEKRYESCGDFADALREVLGLPPYHPRGRGTALAYARPPATSPSVGVSPDPLAGTSDRVAAETIDSVLDGGPAVRETPAAGAVDTGGDRTGHETDEDDGTVSPAATVDHGIPATTTDHRQPAGEPGTAAGLDEPAGKPDWPPAAASADPIAAPSDLVTPVPDPVAPVSDPVAPVSDPVAPLWDPAAPVSDPVAPVSDPVTPVSDPVAPVPDPVAPVPDWVAEVLSRRSAESQSAGNLGTAAGSGRPVGKPGSSTAGAAGEPPDVPAVGQRRRPDPGVGIDRVQPVQRRPGTIAVWIRHHRLPVIALACAALAAAGIIPFVTTNPARPPGPAKSSAPANHPTTTGPVFSAPVPVNLPSDWPNVLVSSLAFSPKGGTLAIASQEICLWNFVTKGCTTRFGTTAYSVALSPDGKTLAAGIAGTTQGNGVRLWNLVTRSQTANFTYPGSQGVYSVAFSSDGKLLAAGDGNGRAYLWNVATKSPVATFTDPGGTSVNSVAFSPNSKLLVAGDKNGTAYLWDVATKSRTAALTDPSSGGVLAVACSSDGTTMAAGDVNGNIYVWNVDTKKRLTTLSDPDGSEIDSVAFSADGKTLAAGDQNGSVYLWHVGLPS